MANQYNLPHNTTYKVLSSNYLSAMDGGGWSCENCNKFITTIVTVENQEGQQFNVGADCALTLAGIGKFEEAAIKRTVSRCKKFYKAAPDHLIGEDEDSYLLFKVVTEDFSGNPVTPFIHVPYIQIEKENMAVKLKEKVVTQAQLLEQYPMLIHSYHIERNFIL